MVLRCTASVATVSTHEFQHQVSNSCFEIVQRFLIILLVNNIASTIGATTVTIARNLFAVDGKADACGAMELTELTGNAPRELSILKVNCDQIGEE
jgi:hypothetical protein